MEGKLWRKSLFAFLFLTLFLAGIFTWILPKLVEDKIEAIILKEIPDSEIGEIDIDLFQNVLCVSKLKGSPPSGIANFPILHCRISEITVKKIHWRDLLSSKVHVESLTIDEPTIEIWKGDSGDQVHSSPSSAKDALEKFLQIDQINLHRGSINVFRKTDSLCLYSAESFEGQLDQLNIELGKDYLLSKDIYDSFTLDISCVEIVDDRHLHRLSAQELNCRSVDSILQISLFEMHPLWSTKDFNSKISQQTNEVDIVVPQVSIHGLNYNLLGKRTFSSREILISQFYFNNLVNKNIIKRTKEFSPLPQQVLANLNYKINVDSLLLNNGTLAYSELIPDRTKAGEVAFNKINAKLKNITNDSTRFELLKNIDITVSAELYDDGLVNLHAQIPLIKDPWNYYLQGQLRNFDLRRANEIIEPAVLIYFKSGKVSELSFQAVANPTDSRGNMEFFYKDLDIDFRQRKFGAKVRNALVEAFIFPQENIKTKRHNIGKIYAERDVNKSIFNHLWAMVFSGIQSTMMPNIILPEELKHERVNPDHVDH